MNYCQFRNLTIKRMANAGGGGLLPAEYQAVEYLQSTGKNWIDTGINVSNSLLTSCDIAIVSGFSFSSLAYIFGVYVESPATRYSCAIASTTSLRLPNGGNFSNYTIPAISYGQKYSLSYRFGETKWESNTVSNASSAINTPKSLWLFARNFNGTEIISKIQIYHAQLGTTNDFAQYRDLYPCYRKSDSVTGMYDLINSEFIPYSGTENFIIGNNV